MLEEYLNLLNMEDIINKRMNQIIEAFVMFYGESERDHIESRLKNTLILSFASLYYLGELATYIKEATLKDTFNISWRLDFNVDGLVRFLDGQNHDFYNMFTSRDKMMFFGDESLSAIDAIKKFKAGNLSKLNQFLEKYNKVKSIADHCQQIVDNESLKSYKIREKYYSQLVFEFGNLIPSSELDEYRDIGRPGPIMRSLFGFNIDRGGHFFDKDSEANIHNPNYPQSQKKKIINARLAFLKAKGYKYLSYDECLNDSECRSLIQDMLVRCRELGERKKELFRLQEIEVAESLDDYKRCKRILDSHNFVNKDYILGPFLYEGFGISVCDENYTFDGTNYIFSPIVFLSVHNDDTTIMHELNHVLEYHVLKVDSDGSRTICGWDKGKSTFRDYQRHKQLAYSGISREYELSSEYVNERIAMDVTQILHDNAGILVKRRGDDIPNYMLMEFLLEEFYLRFKEAIVKSRMHGNIQYLYQKVGKENFDDLNDLVNCFYKEYGFGSKAAEMIDEYKKQENTPGAIIVANFVKKRDVIIEKMVEKLKTNEAIRGSLK